jgi:branched-chain amino acid transport system permease protein
MFQLLLGQFVSGLSGGMVFFLIATGLSMVWGTLGVLNVAHASLYMVGAYLCYTVTQVFGQTPEAFWLAIILAPVGVAIFGGLIEALLIKPIYSRDILFQLILTFGLILIIGDLVKLTWGVQYYKVDIPWPLNGHFNFLGITISYYHLFMIVMGPLILALQWVVLRKTKLGRIIRAVTHSRQMAGALGVNVSLVYTCVFMFASWLAGLGGTLMAPISSVFLGMDTTVTIECFVIVVIGGLGSTGGAFLGAIIFGLANSFGILVLPRLAIAFGFAAMVAVLTLRPWGLLGKPE